MVVTMKSTYQFFKELLKEIFDVTSTLFRIMIPIIIVIKVIEELGGILILSEWLSPIMESVGLPKEMGLVWATTILTNIYAGIIILINSDVPLTVAQASVLGSMMLLAHSLPIEGAIAKKAGVSWLATLSVRVGGSLVLAWLLNVTYQFGDLLNYPATMLWQPEPSADTSYISWVIDQLMNFAVIFMVISTLLLLLKVLKLLGVEKLMAILLRPFLRLLGISKDATNLTIIGTTLGLSFGGGLFHLWSFDKRSAEYLINVRPITLHLHRYQ